MSDLSGELLPYGRQLVEDDDIEAVTEVLRSDYLTTGSEAEKFEAALADKVGAREAVVCSSGSAALHLTMLSLELSPGDVVVVPALTFLATANAARHVGAEIQFADVNPDTGLMGPDELSQAIRKAGQVHAVVTVHYAGQCEAPDTIADVAGCPVIADACHALGAKYATNGIVGDCRHECLSVFSFHPVKTISMGEGGAITTNDLKLARRMRLARNHGLIRDRSGFKNDAHAFDNEGLPNPWYYEMAEPGFNYRASDIHCSLGLSQLRKLSRFVAARQELAAHYDKHLSSFAPMIRPLARSEACTPAWHLYVVHIDFRELGLTRAQMMRRLRAEGIGTQVHYLPLHMQPYYRQRYGAQTLHGAESFYESALTLPLFPGMTMQDVDRVVGALRGILCP